MKKFLLLLTLFLSLAGIAKGDTKEQVMADLGYSDAEAVSSFKVGDVNFAFSNAKYYNSGKSLRMYTGCNITITAPTGYTITGVQFDANSSSGNPIPVNTTVSAGTLSLSNKITTWTGSVDGATGIKLTSLAAQYRATKISVTYTAPSRELGDIQVSYSGGDVTANSTVTVPNGTVFNIAADNATSITVNGTATNAATATYTATTSEKVNVSATDGTNTKTFAFTTDVFTAPDAPTFTIEGEATDNADEYYIGAKLAITATGTIRYTLDGTTIPTAEVGTLYNGEIDLPLGETIVKAVAYDAGNHCGALTEKTYKVIKYTPEISWSAAEAEATLGTAFTAPTLTVTNDLKVSYESSKPEVASITADGVVTPLAMGVTTITATTTETDKYASVSTSYSLKVIDPNVTEVVDLLNQNTLKINGTTYKNYTYESSETGITYVACTNYNSQYSGMTINTSQTGTYYVYPGFAVKSNPNGLVCKSITVEWSSLGRGTTLYVLANNDHGYDYTEGELGHKKGDKDDDPLVLIRYGLKDAWTEGPTKSERTLLEPASVSEKVTYTFPDMATFFGIFTDLNAHYIKEIKIVWEKAVTPEVTMVEDNTNNTITVTVNHADYILHYKKIHNDNWNNHWDTEAAKAPARVAQNTSGEPLADSEVWVSAGTNQITIDKTIADHQNRHYKFTAFHKDDTALANELNHVNFLIDGDGTLTGIEGIGAEAGADAPAEYFDLQGRRVANPVSGLYIRRTGSKVEKVFVK